MAIAASAIASHVHNLGACEGVQVTNMFQKGLGACEGVQVKNMFQKGLKFVTTLFWKC